MLTLPEELLLLALDDTTGADTLGSTLDRALIAAALLDLILQGHIVHLDAVAKSLPASGALGCWYADGAFYLASQATSTGNNYLDHVWTMLATHLLHDRLHSFASLTLLYLNRTNCLSSNVYSAPPDQRLLAAQDFLAREELILKETRFLGIFRQSQLPQGNRSTGEPELRERLRTVLSDKNLPVDERTRALLLLLKSTGLVKTLFENKSSDSLDWRLAQILRLTMESHSPLAEAHRYIVTGIDEFDLSPLQALILVPPTKYQ